MFFSSNKGEARKKERVQVENPVRNQERENSPNTNETLAKRRAQDGPEVCGKVGKGHRRTRDERISDKVTIVILIKLFRGI